MDEWIYDDEGNLIEDNNSEGGTNEPTLDANGTELENGDSVILTKDLPLKGSSMSFKRGDVMKNIKLTGDPGNIECRVGKTTAVIKTEFLKKKK